MDSFVHVVHPTDSHPLFDRIEFGVELREEKDWEAVFLAADFECGFDGGKVGLIEKETTATTVDSILGTLEVLALRVEACLLVKTPLHEDHRHALEDTGLWVSFREVERLWLAIWECPIDHLNAFLELLSIWAVNRTALFVRCIDFHKGSVVQMSCISIRFHYFFFFLHN